MKKLMLYILVVVITTSVCACKPGAMSPLAELTTVSIKPTADCNILDQLPDTIKFNPDLNEYYDSKYIEWDAEAQVYLMIDVSVIPSGVESIDPIKDTSSQYAWFDTLDPKNNLDKAILQFIEAYNNLPKEALFLDNPILYYKDIISGPYGYFAELSMSDLPRMYSYIIEGPSDILSYHLTSAIQLLISRIPISEWNWYTNGEEYITQYKPKLYLTEITILKNSIKMAALYLKYLYQGDLSSASKEQILSRFGIAGLPFLYEEIITKRDDTLLPYAHAVLPTWIILREEKVGVTIDNTTDINTIRELLGECAADAIGITTVGNMDIEKK